jgi:hypothetical protein
MTHRKKSVHQQKLMIDDCFDLPKENVRLRLEKAKAIEDNDRTEIA